MVMNLPHIKGVNVARIDEFLNKLFPSIQALESVGKLREIAGYARMTLNKLKGIRADPIRLDDDWQEWGFPKLVEALTKWAERNSIHNEIREKVFTTKGTYQKRQCVYCGNSNRKSADCKKVQRASERRNTLREKDCGSTARDLGTELLHVRVKEVVQLWINTSVIMYTSFQKRWERSKEAYLLMI